MVGNYLCHLEELDFLKTEIPNFVDQPFLTCDLNHLEAIKEINEGYICQDYRCVLEVQKLVHTQPYKHESVKYAVLNKTYIGTRRERMCNHYTQHLEKLDTYHLPASIFYCDIIRNGKIGL